MRVCNEETKAIWAMFGVGCIDVDLDRLAETVSFGMVDDDNLNSIDNNDEGSIGGESPLTGNSLLLNDDDLDSIDDNDEDSIGGESPLALQLRGDGLSDNNAISDFPLQVNISCTR